MCVSATAVGCYQNQGAETGYNKFVTVIANARQKTSHHGDQCMSIGYRMRYHTSWATNSIFLSELSQVRKGLLVR